MFLVDAPGLRRSLTYILRHFASGGELMFRSQTTAAQLSDHSPITLSWCLSTALAAGEISWDARFASAELDTKESIL